MYVCMYVCMYVYLLRLCRDDISAEWNVQVATFNKSQRLHNVV